MRYVGSFLVAWAMLGVWSGTVQAQRAPAARILPDNTVLYAGIPSPPEALKRLQQSSIGAISRDPQFEGLTTHLYGSMASLAQERIGLSASELLEVAQGEVAFAIVPVQGKAPAMLVLLDAGEQIASARKLVDRLGQALEESGFSVTRSEAEGATWIEWESTGVSAPRQRRVACLEKDKTVVLGTDPDVLREMLSNWGGRPNGSLAEVHAFATLQKADGDPPQALVYADPVGIIQSTAQLEAGARLAMAFLPVLGLDGIEGVAVTATLDTSMYDFLIRGDLLLSSQRGGVLGVLGFAQVDPRPEPWAPVDAADYLTLRWEFPRSYEALKKLVDSIRGEGFLAEWFRRRFKGIGVDWEKEVLPLLEGRVTILSRLQEPLGPNSRARLFGIKLKDPNAAKKLLERVVDQQRSFLIAHNYAGQNFWRVTPPALSDEAPDESRPSLCFGLVEDYLLLADRVVLYEKALATRLDASQGLAESLEFKLVASRARREARDGEMVLLNFSRPEETMRWLYAMASNERVREGMKRSGEKNVLLGSVNEALEANPLPPFSVVQQYMAPGGAVLTDDESGLHYTAFGLRRPGGK